MPNVMNQLAKVTDWLAWEINPEYSRLAVTFAGPGAKTIYRTGTLLGKQTANGKYYPLNPAASDGTQNCAGILYSAQTMEVATDKKVTILARGPAQVIKENLELTVGYVATITSNQRDAALAQLAGGVTTKVRS